MSRHVFTSDLHLGHERVAKLRGFDDVEDHDRAILEGLRDETYSGDVVWILGDLVGTARGLTDALACLRYHGQGRRLRLVLGNHDPAHPMNRNAFKHTAALAEVFEWWGTAARTSICGRSVLLSHFPYVRDRDETRYPQWRVPNLGEWLLHGHTHGDEKVTHYRHPWASSREIHVGWDAWQRPVADHELAGLIEESEA